MGSRSFLVLVLVLVPSSYSSNSGVKHPLVLSYHYHGFAVNETTQEVITSFSDEGIQVNGTDIAAVYPAGVWGTGRPGEGPTRAWQGAPCSAPGVDDVNIFSLRKRSCTSLFADIVYPEDGGCSTIEPLPRHKDIRVWQE